MLAAGISPESVFISDIVAERLEFLSHELGVKVGAVELFGLFYCFYLSACCQ